MKGGTVYKQGMFKHQKMAEIFHRNALAYEQFRRDREKFLQTHTYTRPGTGNPLKENQFDSPRKRIPFLGRVASYMRIPVKK